MMSIAISSLKTAEQHQDCIARIENVDVCLGLLRIRSRQQLVLAFNDCVHHGERGPVGTPPRGSDPFDRVMQRRSLLIHCHSGQCRSPVGSRRSAGNGERGSHRRSGAPAGTTRCAQPLGVFHWQAACLAAMASPKRPDWIIVKSMTLFRNLGISKCNDGVTKSPDPNQNARPNRL